jgi:hypothetical protein
VGHAPTSSRLAPSQVKCRKNGKVGVDMASDVEHSTTGWNESVEPIEPCHLEKPITAVPRSRLSVALVESDDPISLGCHGADVPRAP